MRSVREDRRGHHTGIVQGPGRGRNHPDVDFGCATEEAYPFAILLLKASARHPLRPAIQLFGSDLDCIFYTGQVETDRQLAEWGNTASLPSRAASARSSPPSPKSCGTFRQNGRERAWFAYAALLTTRMRPCARARFRGPSVIVMSTSWPSAVRRRMSRALEKFANRPFNSAETFG